MSIVDRIENIAGVIHVRMVKIKDGNPVGFHRTCIEPGGSIDAQMAMVNAHLAQMGIDTVSETETDKIKNN